ncbi:zinc ABC transporter solute-binding protein [Defluviitalea raffinosedens]|jgi:zinc transport system substrate-binding protein|uniref:Zinc ABC transporter solute-binding protein n=1 Tax=Defluviitalea raffinosedens TaxID=1450156 RepID=A0A7C8HD76_9FIRM|nr:metal ABC transporter substrate-binding protein [Defluviitalea raffinosedens]KAE9629458.1 zinc ABC transporter solute-binding protein [Defluviitalea raffinosedens]HHW66458.1 zinc ABC transporter substrate-binding protein [Candidatus Epulonipiscium sp.]
MKKYISFFLIVTMSVLYLSGCSTSIIHQNQQSEKFQIVTTIFPVFDWVREIIGDDADYVEIAMLIDNGADLHSYQPTADDLIKISTCDMFIYVGGESDRWVEDALKNAVNKDMVVINLINALGDLVKKEEIVEGMQDSDHDYENEADLEHNHENEIDYEAESEHSHEMDHETESEHGHKDEEEHHELDEHIWLSLKNAQLLCWEIATQLCEKDPQHKDDYLTNLSVYIKKLSALDAKYQKVVDHAVNKTLLFGDRFPFRYLVDDYNLDYYAAFSGCSAETEASFETITFLSNKVDELGLNSVLKIDGTKHNIAETVVSNTKNKNQQILSMNSMQSITGEDVKNGISYLSVMEQNLEVLKEALK